MSGVLIWTAVAVLGALGAYARFALGALVEARRPGAFPYGTFAVNLSGALVLGLLTGLSVTGDALLVLGTGFLGAYTTFSTWMFESVRLAEDGGRRLALLNLLVSLAAGLAAVALGRALGEAL